MRKAVMAAVGVLLCGIVGCGPRQASAFRITSPTAGSQVEAGSTITVHLDSGGVGVLMGVLFASSGTGKSVDSPANDTELDVLPPYTWTFQVPRNYVGPLTFTAIGRVLGQKTGVAPEAEVTINVVLPANVQITAIRVRDDQRTLFMEVEERLKVYVYGQFSDGVEREVSSVNSGTQYEVADPGIAVVDGEGLITVLAPGTTTIKITNGSKQLQIEVRARPAE